MEKFEKIEVTINKKQINIQDLSKEDYGDFLDLVHNLRLAYIVLTNK